jgi:VanZ family protein
MNAFAEPVSLRRAPLLLIFRCAFLMAVIMLSVGSLIPSDYLPVHPLRDKLLHFGGYAVVSGLAMFAIRSPARQVTCLLLLTVLGIALEFGQMLVPGRAFELWDMAANGCGVFVAFQASRLLLS